MRYCYLQENKAMSKTINEGKRVVYLSYFQYSLRILHYILNAFVHRSFSILYVQFCTGRIVYLRHSPFMNNCATKNGNGFLLFDFLQDKINLKILQITADWNS